MYKIFGDMLSGNCYKIKLLVQFLGIEHEWVYVDILASETHTEEFKQMNPNAKIPVIKLDERKYLCNCFSIPCSHGFLGLGQR